MKEFYNSGQLPSSEEGFSFFEKKEKEKRKEKGETNYFPSDDLKKAIDVALLLNKPLLIAGLPGTGKTALAAHLTELFDLGEPLVFHTKTTSTAKDLLYTYNALGHFQYSRNQKNEVLSAKEIDDKFIHYEALGKAIKASANGKNEKRKLVLIDEIDKAPRDLPNDLLDIIDNMRFKVDELHINKNKGEKEADISEIKGNEDFKPILILTSNSEKSLPEPFLRRCVFFYIDFPEQKQLRKILRAKLNFGYDDSQWNVIIDYFNKIKEEIRGKEPATAELIMWAWLLKQKGISPEMLHGTEDMDGDKKQDLKASFSVLIKDNEDWKSILKKYFN